MTYEYVLEPKSRTFAKILDERAVHVDLNKIYKYQSIIEDENQENKLQKSFDNNLLRGLHESNKLTKLFFSKENVEHLDERLRYTVYLLSNKQYVLGPQNKTELLVIMRSIYLAYSNNLDYLITTQIKKLNDIVVSQTAPKLLSFTTQYLRYLEDINESHKILIARPVNTSNAGLKILDSTRALGF